MLQLKQPSFVTLPGGRKLAYEEVCPANPKGTILLLTGLASKRLAWYKQMKEFGQFYRTIALDHRDVGDSDQTPAPYGIIDQAEDAAMFLQALGIGKANIIGISMGGFISLELTLRHPEIIEKLVLVSTSAGGLTNVPSSPRLWLSFFRREKLEPGEAARRVYGRIMGPGYADAHPDVMSEIADIARYRPMSEAAYQRQLRACLRHNAANRLDQIHVPTLVIHGDKDLLVPTANGKRLARKIPGAKLLLYPGAGHLPIIEQSERFNRDVLNFLDGR